MKDQPMSEVALRKLRRELNARLRERRAERDAMPDTEDKSNINSIIGGIESRLRAVNQGADFNHFGRKTAWRKK